MTIRKGSNIIAGTSQGDLNNKANISLDNLDTAGQAILDAKAADNAVVHRIGEENITGKKIFTDTIDWKAVDVIKGTAPTENRSGGIHFIDKNGERLGHFRFDLSPFNTMSLTMQARKMTATSDVSTIGIHYPVASEPYGETPQLRPNADNSCNLGLSNRRWKQLYAGTTTINTSDERLKQQIATISDDVLDAWSEVNFCQFKFNDAVKEKGSEKARYHTGLIAQRIKEKFEAHNVDPFAYGLLCYDEWEAEKEEKDEDGNIIRPAIEAGNRYSLRYEECLCMEAAYQRRRADRIEERLKALEEKLK